MLTCINPHNQPHPVENVCMPQTHAATLRGNLTLQSMNKNLITFYHNVSKQPIKMQLTATSNWSDNVLHTLSKNLHFIHSSSYSLGSFWPTQQTRTLFRKHGWQSHPHYPFWGHYTGWQAERRRQAWQCFPALLKASKYIMLWTLDWTILHGRKAKRE